MSERERKFPSTGYWIFLCNTGYWNADEWLALNEQELLYRISNHHKNDMAPGQFGLLRLDKDHRSRAVRKGRPKLEPGIYAIFEVVGQAVYATDPDTRHYNVPEFGGPRWRVPIRVVSNLLSSPVLASDLPQTAEFTHIHHGLQTTTIAISEHAFRTVVSNATRRDIAVETSAKEQAIKRMAKAAFEIAASSNGQEVSRTIKKKELKFPSSRDLEQYIAVLVDSQCGLCAITGVPLQYDGRHTDSELLCSLDRIDSNRHYESGNLQIVCRFVNRWKSNGEDGEFRRLIEVVRSTHKGSTV